MAFMLISLSSCDVLIDSYDRVVPENSSGLSWDIANIGYSTVVAIQTWRLPWWVGLLSLVAAVAVIVIVWNISDPDGFAAGTFIVLIGGTVLGCLLIGFIEGGTFMFLRKFMVVVSAVLIALSVLAVLVFPIAARSLLALLFSIVIFGLLFFGCAIVVAYVARAAPLIFFLIFLPAIIGLVWFLFMHM